MLQLFGDGGLHLFDHPLEGLQLDGGVGGGADVNIERYRLLEVILVLGSLSLGQSALANEFSIPGSNGLGHSGDGAVEFFTMIINETDPP